MNTKRVLVAGATGYLGKYLVKELKKRGFWVRVLIRKGVIGFCPTFSFI